VITGFEPIDLLDGVLRTVRLLEAGEVELQNQYSRIVTRAGNVAAQRLVWSAFEVCDRKWRGIGTIPKSGLRLRYELQEFDAERRFDVGAMETLEPAACISGQILRGLKKPHASPASFWGSHRSPLLRPPSLPPETSGRIVAAVVLLVELQQPNMWSPSRPPAYLLLRRGF
jgi:hydrogenase expression/formation protein HypD